MYQNSHMEVSPLLASLCHTKFSNLSQSLSPKRGWLPILETTKYSTLIWAIQIRNTTKHNF